MRQLTFVGAKRLEWHDVPAPELATPLEALVAPIAVTTCDLDRSLIKGRVPFPGPIALGHEFCAVVTDVGDSVREVAPGDRVVVPAQISCGACDRCRSGRTAFCRAVPPNSMYGLGEVTGNFGGAFSDLVRVPFADAMLVKLPDHVDPISVAAASDNLTNAYEAVIPHLERMPGASVLVAGVGATGMYTVLMAKAGGAGRIGYLDHDTTRLALAASLGAVAIPLGPEQRGLAQSETYEIGVDTRGDPNTLEVLLRSLAPTGICTSVSLYFSETRVPMLEMCLRGIRLEATPTNIRAHLPAVLALVAAGRVAAQRVTSEVLPWSRLPEALIEPSMKPVFIRSQDGT
jgi:alcohol dehydrogenase